MDNPRQSMAEKAIDEARKRYSSPPPQTVEGEDFNEVEPTHETLKISDWSGFLKHAIMSSCPDCNERKQALLRLQEAVWWADLALQQTNDART